MTPTVALEASTSLLAQLANPAARALTLAVAAGLGLAAFRVKAATLRLFTWTAVLYAALAMPFLGHILPPLPVPTPAFLQPAWDQNASRGLQVSQPAAAGPISSAPIETLGTRHEALKKASSPAIISRPSSLGRKQIPAAPASILWPSIPWKSAAIYIYLAVAFLLLARFFIGLAFGRRLRRASQIIAEPRLVRRLASYASGLARIPQATESDFISVPVTMGALRSTILLPTSWREWDDAQLDAVVAHEMSHVARRDPLTQRLSLLHRAIFWFSPLAWWLDRQLADLAEQASDEAALSCGVDRKDYARTLLGFFEALQSAPGRVWWQGVSMAKAGQAEVRVERILAWKGSSAMRLQKSIAVALLTLAVPVIYLAASVHPANHMGPHGWDITADQAAPSPAPTPKVQSNLTPAPAPTPATEATPPSEPALAPTAVSAAISGEVSGVPTPAVAPVAGSPARISGFSRHGFSYSEGDDDGDDLRFVIASGKSDSYTMSGSSSDVRMVEKLKKTIPGDFIWFEHDWKSYIIRDQATVDRARKLWAPQEELGKKQEELGKQQEVLGKQQEELGKQMEQIHVNVPDMTAELDKLRAELKQLNSSATMDQIGQIQSHIGELQSKIGELQSHAGEQQSKLGEKMSALGEKQSKLGEQQGKFGEQQGELARQASHQIKQLLDEALAKGTAQVQQ